MDPKKKDYFANKAADYDEHKPRTENVNNIAQTILKELKFSKGMHIMDFGSGTGLLLTGIAPHVGEVTAVDVSPSMNKVLKSKLDGIDCELHLAEIDLTKKTLDSKFDSIISSMTIHHIENPLALFKRFYSLLEDNGTIAIADLEKEDGSFHSEDTGVFHFGFERDVFMNYASRAGFRDLKIQTANIIEKPTGTYPVFLLTGRK